MKYDLKAMKFKPDAGDIIDAFQWDYTLEGYVYWDYQDENGITPEGQAKWDAMKRQWNEENGVVATRYVVLADDETIICTRAEAEDLVATGVVDAVYKLGDKVEVTVKVEFDT
jgi:hypothetical protein